MTDEQIIEMAREANLPSCLATHPKALKRFAKLVAQHERGTVEDRIVDLFAEMENPYLPDIVRAIGARGEA